MGTKNRHFVIVAILFLMISILSGRPPYVSAQNNVIDDVTGLINQGKIEEASERIEWYQKKYPNNVDVLMMKGNVILNQYFFDTPGVSLSVNDNESIYDSSIAFVGEAPNVIPEAVAREVASYWIRCLNIDNSRSDIHKGLCYLYAMALMKDELIAHLPKMKDALRDEAGL